MRRRQALAGTLLESVGALPDLDENRWHVRLTRSSIVNAPCRSCSKHNASQCTQTP